MRFVKSLFVVLAAVFAIAVAREARAQQPDPYVSCVKCHALPMQQALAQMQGHGSPYPPAPEQTCTDCHDTWNHEQNPLPNSGYFLWRAWGGPGSPLANACLSCHTTLPPGHHTYDVFPYFDATPPSNPPLLTQGPTSILPLFTPSGAPDQYNGGLVCSTCHDPHNPSYPVNGSSKFLRIGSYEQTTALCGYCHGGIYPPTTGADLYIPSDSDSVRFTLTSAGDIQIEVTVRNRGNGYPDYSSGFVSWDDGSGYPYPVGQLFLNYGPPPGGEAVAYVSWTPPPEYTYGEGFFVFELPPQPLLNSPYPVEFVRSMDIPPTPTNLRVTNVGIGEIHLAWDLPLNPTGPLGWEVYRDGVKIAEAPILYSPTYDDFNLAPETPHIYTVRAVRINGGLPSQQSEPVGATTTAGMVVRVPQDYPTIQDAINASWSMTSIHVAPGTYTGPLNLSNKYGITIKGQDANGCVLDYSASPGMIDLGNSTGPGNTLSGFTVRNGTIFMGPGDVVTGCVLTTNSMHPGPAVMGGGLVAHCIFDTGYQPAFMIDPNRFLTSVNSIYLGSYPFDHYAPPASAALLLNNNFPSWYEWWQYPGSGNFWDPPVFAAPGPPMEYIPAASPTFDRGLMLGTPFLGAAPDVGVFEFGQSYTPQPPANLVATFVATPFRRIELTWTGSIDAPARVLEYQIFRSTTDPAFPPGLETPLYATVPAGTTFFSDYDVPAGNTYSYQVRAYALPSGPSPAYELLSAPTNTASAGDSNTPPVAVDDVATTPENQPVSVVVLANDSDPDGDVFHILDVGFPQHGSASLNPDESIEYTPAPGFSGPDVFSYTVLDVRGGSATAYVYVTVVPNRPPVAAHDTYSTPEDTGLSVPAPGVLGNDTDLDGDPLEALLVTGPAHGTLTLNLDGSFVYVPAAHYHGPDSFTYLAGDGQLVSAAAAVTIHVMYVNDPPVASGQTVATAEDTAVPVTLAATDVDGDPLTYEVVPPTNGTLSGVAPNLTYTPNANYNGPDSFAFSAADGQSVSALAIVTITVTPVNDPPVFAMGANQKVNNTAGTQLVVGWATGIGDGDPEVAQNLMFNATNDNPALFQTQPVILLDGELYYTPAANAGGVATVTVSLTDDDTAGGPSITTPAQTFTITVNRPPVAMEQSVMTTRNTPLTVTLNAWDMDEDALTYAVVSGPAHGSLSGTAPNLTYTPALDYNGPDSFSFTANDGLATSAPATFTINVNAPPVANAGADQTGNIGQVLTFSAAASYDTDGTITFYSWSWGDNAATGYDLIAAATHTYANPGTYTVTLTVTDNNGATATDTLIVSVNAPPVANAGVDQAGNIGQVLSFSGAASTDSDGTIASYSWNWGDGTAAGSGVSATHAYATAGSKTVTLTVTDNNGATATDTLIVTVNAPPVANAGADQAGNIAQVLSFSGAASTDSDGTIASYSWNWGDGTAAGSGVSATHAYATAGSKTVTLTVTDNNGATATDTLIVTVNAPPVANAGPDQTGLVGQVLSFSGAASSDVEGPIASYSWNWGDGTANGSGVSATHTYTTAGSKTVTLTVTDNNGATATDTLIVTVNAVNLALNKTATASTSRSGYLPAKAVDGSTSTSWMSNKTSGTQWLKVDLGASKTISNVKVRWQSGYHAKSFTVETSTNGTTWTNRYSIVNVGAGGTTDISFTAASARYVRVSCTKAINSSYYGILELEAYQ